MPDTATPPVANTPPVQAPAPPVAPVQPTPAPAPQVPAPEAPKQPEVSLELLQTNPIWQRFNSQNGVKVTVQGVDGAKSSGVSMLAPKKVAEQLGVTVKSDNVKLLRKARSLAIKQYGASLIGQDSVNPNVEGVSVRQTKGKNGVRKVITLFEPANTSADDQFFADELGLTLDEVRQRRQAQAAKKAVIDVNGKPVTPTTPPANTTEMPK